MEKITPQEIIDLVKRLPHSEHHIYEENETHYITNEWLIGGFGGRSFSGKTLEEAAQKMINFLYAHMGSSSMLGYCVRKSGFPDLKQVEKWCTPPTEQ
jgi:hypothetical protein